MTVAPFTFPHQVLGQHLAIIGKVGSGKTYTAKGMVERLLHHNCRVCILDPTGVWWGLRSRADGSEAGFPIVVFGGARADVPIAASSGAALAKVIATNNLPAIIDLSEMLIGERHRFTTDFAEAIYRDNRTPLHLVIDEADEFAPQNPMPETKRMLHHVDRLVRRGRVRGFRVMLITQRPAALHKNVLTQANTLIAMRLTAPQDRNAMKAWIEGQGDAAQGQAVLDSLPRLQTGQGWVWAPELDLLERATFPRIVTFDSSRTPTDDEKVLEPTKLAAVDLSAIDATMIEATKPPETKAKAGAGVSEAEVQRRISEALEQRPPVTVEKVPAAVLEAAGWALAAINKLMAELGDVEAASKRAAPPALVDKSTKSPGDKTANLQSLPAKRVNHRPAPAAVNGKTHAGVDGLKRGAIKILQQLAARAPAGYTRSQVGVLTKFTPSGGTFGNYMSALRRAGHVAERAGLIYATEHGIRALGADVPAAPTSHAEAMELWQKALKKGAFEMLKAVVTTGTAGLTRERLATAVGMEPSGGTFGNYLSNLRRNGLITEHDKRLVANDILFPEKA